jgi:hypothetical protein
MPKKLDKQTAGDVVLLLATFRCFEEQLYNLKGKHAQIVKQYFNQMMNTVRQYESFVTKQLDLVDKEKQDQVHDTLMEVIYSIQNLIDKEHGTGRN